MTQSPRVLLLFSTSGLGGAERSLTRMALTPETRTAYHLGTLSGAGPWTDWVRQQGGNPVIFGGHDPILWGLLGLFQVLRYVRREKIDVVYVCGLKASLGLRLLKFLMPGVRLVHGIRWNPGSTSRLDRAFRLVERTLSPLVDLYITNSRIAAETLTKSCGIPQKKIRVIYNGLSEFPQNADIPPFFSRPNEILTIANLTPRKGHREFLPAIARVRESIPDAHFTFVGRDDMAGEVQRTIAAAGLSHAVTCVGGQDDVTPFLKRARIFALPSLWNEGCPTAILESLSWGVPVVAYGIDGIPELVTDGADGRVIPPRDHKTLAEGLIALLNDETRAETMGAEGRARVKDLFSAGACARLHDQAFNDLQQSSKG